MKVLLLRLIPIAGWLYLLAGPKVLGRSPLLRTLWWIDAVLSIGVHAAQIPAALRATAGSGRSRLHTAVMTQLFGLTWWRTQPGAAGEHDHDGKARS